jgi:lactoylglutathione lyase
MMARSAKDRRAVLTTSSDQARRFRFALDTEEMIPLQALFESHLTVSNLERARAFYEDKLRLELAHSAPDRRAVFYWLGGPGTSMLGLWETGASPQRTSLHLAFRTDLTSVLDAPRELRAANIAPLDFWGAPSEEATVIAWMPAASVYFHDPDGNLLEFLAMLPEEPQPELGVIPWSRWQDHAGRVTE